MPLDDPKPPWPDALAEGANFIRYHVQPHLGDAPVRLVFCRNRSKQAIFSSWQAQSPHADNPAEIEGTLHRAKVLSQHAPNPALLVPPGILVVDVDPRNGGDDTLKAKPPLPKTLTVSTPSGGHHYYYRVPPDRRWGKNPAGPGVDFLISYHRQGSGLVGRYVLVPGAVIGTNPARHYSLSSTDTVADAPEWILDLSTAAAPNEKKPSKGLAIASIPDQETREVSPEDCTYIASCIAPYREAGTGHQLALALVGACATALWTEDSTKRLIKTLCATVGDPEVADRLRVVEDGFARLRENKALANFALLDGLLGDEVSDLIMEMLHDLGDFPGYELSGPTEALYRGRSLHMYLAYDLASESPPTVSYLVDNTFPRGQLLLFCGPPKGGKTTILTDLVGAILAGTAFLGRGTHLDVDEMVFWASEEPRDLFFERLINERRIPLDHLRKLLVMFRREAGPGYRWGEWIRELTKYVMDENSKHPRIALLVIDTFQDWTDIVDEGENSTGSIKKEMQPLQDFAARTGITVVVLHHTRKGSAGTLVEQVRGATALTGMVDGIIALLPAKGNKRHFKSIGRLSPTCWELEVDFDHTTGYRLVEPKKPKEKLSKAEKAEKALSDQQEKVLAAIAHAMKINAPTVAHRGGVTRVQIKLALNDDTALKPIPDITLYGNIQQLIKLGKIEVVDAGGPGREVYYAVKDTNDAPPPSE